jgi:hypothetical protein
MWQQSIHGSSLLDWAQKQMGARPKRVFPIITHLAELRVDKLSRRGYLEPLIKHGQLYQDQFWEQPQWLHVSDLEGLASVAEQGLLDLEVLLLEKNNQYRDERFDVFLLRRFGDKLVDRMLHEKGHALLQSAGISFWPESIKQWEAGRYSDRG